MEYSAGQYSFSRAIQSVGRLRNDETRHIRRKRVTRRVADHYAYPRSVQPHVVEPVANCGDLARIVIHGNHMQVRLPGEFLDQAATVDSKYQGVTVANARGLKDGGGFLGPRVDGRGRSVGHGVCCHITRLRSGKGQNTPLGRHDEQLLVGCQHPLRRAFDFHTPHHLRLLVGRVNRFHDARSTGI